MTAKENGKLFGEYMLHEQLGSTAYCRSFKVTKSGEAGTSHRLKIFNKKLSGNEQFLRYYSFINKLFGHLEHAGIPQIVETGTVDDCFYILSEYVEGINGTVMLDHTLRGNVKLTPQRIKAIIFQLIELFEYTSNVLITEKKRGITHSNIILPNVFLCGDGQIYLTDFRPPFTRPDLLQEFGMLPADHCSPSMLAKRPITARSDIFQLGLLLYELVYQEPFFKDVNSESKLMSELKRKIPLKNSPAADSPQNINSIIARLLSVSPRSRFKGFQRVRNFIFEEWGPVTLEESREILSQYYQELENDALQDILADFKGEIEDTLGFMGLGDEADYDEEYESEYDEGDDELEGEKRPNRNQEPVNYAEIGVQNIVVALKHIKLLLTQFPDNEDLNKAAWALFLEIDKAYKIHHNFLKAQSALESQDGMTAIVHFLSILSIDYFYIDAFQMLREIRNALSPMTDAEQERDELTIMAAMRAMQGDNDDEAIATLHKIPENSIFYRYCQEIVRFIKKKQRMKKDSATRFNQAIQLDMTADSAEIVTLVSQALTLNPENSEMYPVVEKLASPYQSVQAEEMLSEEGTSYEEIEGPEEEELSEEYDELEFVEENVDETDVGDDLEAENKLHEQQLAVIESKIQEADKAVEQDDFDTGLAILTSLLDSDDVSASMKEKISSKIGVVRKQYIQSERVREEAVIDETILELSPTTPIEIHDEFADVDIEKSHDFVPEDARPSEVAEKPVVEGGDPETLRNYLDQGLQLYGSNDYKGAIEIWKKVLAIDSKHEQAIEYIELAKEELQYAGYETEKVDNGSSSLIVDTGYKQDPAMIGASTDRVNIEDIGSEELPELALETPVKNELVPDDLANSQNFDYQTDTLELEDEGDFVELSDDTSSFSGEAMQLDDAGDFELSESLPPEINLPDETFDDIAELTDADSVVAEVEELHAYEELEEVVQEEASLSEDGASSHQLAPQKVMNKPPVSAPKLMDEAEIESLFTEGLAHYEEDRIEEAITIWSTVLHSAPEHKKTKIFIEKAKEKLAIQLEKMDELQTKSEKKKKNRLIFIGIGVLVLLVISVGGLLSWNAYQKSSSKSKALQSFADKHYDEAIINFEKYLTFEEKDVAALEKLGKSYLYLDQPDKTIEIYRRLIDLGNKDENTYLVLGLAYYNNGNFQEALENYKIAQNFNPDATEPLLGIARSSQKLGDSDSAIAAYDKVREKAPSKIGDPDWIIIGNALIDKGDYQSSIAAFRNIQEESINSEFGLGRSYYESEEFEEAVVWFTKAKERDPQFVRNRLYLGKCFYRLKEYEQAISEYLAIIEMYPEDLDVYFELGTAYLKIDKHDDAISYYNKALQYHPDNAKLHFSLGVTYHQKGEYEKGIEQYKLAVAVRSNYSEAYANLGSIYFKLKDMDSAKKAWLQSLKSNPDQPVIQSYLRRLGVR